MTTTIRRTQVQTARARAALLATHAQLAGAIAMRLGDRLSTTRIVEIYCQALELTSFDEIWLRIHTVAEAGTGDTARDEVSARSRSAVERAWHRLAHDARAAVAPIGDRSLQERLAYEIAAARTFVLKVHVRNALAFAQALAPEVGGPAAVAGYVRELDVQHDLRGAVFALAVAQLGAAGAAGSAGMLPPSNDFEITDQEPTRDKLSG